MLQQTTPLQDVVMPAEAGFSTNMYLNHPKMGRLQFTFRGASSRDWGLVLEDVDRFLHYMHEKGWKFDGEKLEAPAQPSEPPQPTYQPIDDRGNEVPPTNSFIADHMEAAYSDGKWRFKVKGGNFKQYGLTVWDEVLEAAGLKFDAANPSNVPNITGWRADYVEDIKDGQKRRKVTRLLPPK